MTNSSLLALCGLFLATTSALTAQTTVSVPCNLDNTLYESPTGGLSNGKGVGVFSGATATGSIRRALLRFDVAGTLPAGAVVLSAVVNLNVTQSTVFLPTPATGHRVLQAWGEGNSNALGGGGGGTAATLNDATWLHTFWSTSFWTTPGGDFAAAPSFTLAMPGLGAGSSNPSEQAAADVQSWLNNPATNFGWLIKIVDESVPSTARRIASRESATNKPTLSVTYLLPGQVGTVGIGCPVGSGTFQDAYVGTPTGGTTIQIVQTNAPVGTIGLNYLSLGANPAGTALLPGCSIWLPLSQPLITGNLFVTNGVGGASSPFPLPSGFPGFLIATQAVAIDASPLGFTLSNAAVLVLN
jgi:hypothetical protein